MPGSVMMMVSALSLQMTRRQSTSDYEYTNQLCHRFHRSFLSLLSISRVDPKASPLQRPVPSREFPRTLAANHPTPWTFAGVDDVVCRPSRLGPAIRA
jgi:hypothetical protein